MTEICDGNRLKLCSLNNCENCKEKSFFSMTEYLDNWSSKNKLKPRQVFKNSNKKYWFDCHDCKHPFLISLGKITCSNRWCPYCASKILCNDNNCNFCFNKSFFSNEKSNCWDYDLNYPIKPRDIFKNTHIQYWFECNICFHVFKMCPNDVTTGYWCPYCSHNKLCENENCYSCEKNSLQRHPSAKFWSDLNLPIKPRNVFKYSTNKYYFDCYICNEAYDVVIYYVTTDNVGCSKCTYKTEHKLLVHLKENYKNILTQKSYKWSIGDKKQSYKFDFVIEELKIIIELDGKQHFEQISNWTSPEITLNRDRYKMKKALENGYSVIRILQEDVLYDRNDWKKNLENAIKKYDKPTFIFIANGNEYEKHKIVLNKDEEIEESEEE